MILSLRLIRRQGETHSPPDHKGKPQETPALTTVNSKKLWKIRNRDLLYLFINPIQSLIDFERSAISFTGIFSFCLYKLQ